MSAMGDASRPSDNGDSVTGRRPRRVTLRYSDEEAPDLDRFGALLVLTVVSVVAMSLVDLRSITNEFARNMAGLSLSMSSGITLVLALRSSGVARRLRRVAEILVVVAAVASLAAMITSLVSDIEIPMFTSYRPATVWVGIALASPIAVSRRLLQHPRATRQTLIGAVSAYLLIALSWSYLFLAIDGQLDSGFFGAGTTPSHEFMYFSLVTITTLGYGDLAPVERFGRLAATSEAVVGQVYLVTFVAMVVGLMIQQRNTD
jgi:hypothetical protein